VTGTRLDQGVLDGQGPIDLKRELKLERPGTGVEENVTNQPSSLAAAFFATARGRLISALVIIALLLGIAAEGISIVNGYWTTVKTKTEVEIMTVPAVEWKGPDRSRLDALEEELRRRGIDPSK
jgi:hypothetical protein